MRIRVKEHIWNRHEADAQGGAMVHNDIYHVFIPATHLRRVADKLHDLADDFESRP